MAEHLNLKNLVDRLTTLARHKLIIRYWLELEHSYMPQALHVEMFLRDDGMHRAHIILDDTAAGTPLPQLTFTSSGRVPGQDWFAEHCRRWIATQEYTRWGWDSAFIGVIGDGRLASETDPRFMLYHGRLRSIMSDLMRRWSHMRELDNCENNNQLSIEFRIRHRFEKQFGMFVRQAQRSAFKEN